MHWRAARLAAVVAGVVVAAAVLPACGSTGRSAQQTAEGFVAAWNHHDAAAMAKLVEQPQPGFAAGVDALTAHLGATSATRTVGKVAVTGSTASAPLSESYRLPGVGTWSDKSVLHLVHRSGQWLVSWSPAALDPALHRGDHLSLSYTWAPRAPILGAGGAALTAQEPEVVVGVEGSRVKDAAHLTGVLEASGASAAEVSAALAAAAKHPTFFEPVFTVSAARYEALGGNAGALHTEPGTVFQHVSQRSAISPGLAAHVVGSVGPITAEELHRLGPPYDASSVVGQSGIEYAYEKQLAGKPGGAVHVVDSKGRSVATLATFNAHPGTPVTTTIDPAVQSAAEAAMAGVGGTAALVAVRASTGEILASVSLPASAAFDQALEGEYPPGSTFKILTSTALFEAGLTPTAAASCPPTATVDGETFHNAEGDGAASNLAQAFTESCNTAFVQLATGHLHAADFPSVASLYHIGDPLSIGLPAFAGKVPAPKDGADLAATAIGQGSVLVSPLNMAMVTAAVASGTARSPRLVVGGPGGPTRQEAAATPLPAGIAAELQPMMASVASSGTAANTGLPPDTYVKTGTPEYGSGNPLPTDAWLVGYRGDVAFAMVVHDSKGDGGPLDGPVIAKFLDALAASPG